MNAVIELTAHNPNTNLHRVYVIIVSDTLFGDYSLICRYGRQNTKLRELPFLFDDSKHLSGKVKAILQRRLNAKHRIGCNYIVISKKFDDEFANKIAQNINCGD